MTINSISRHVDNFKIFWQVCDYYRRLNFLNCISFVLVYVWYNVEFNELRVGNIIKDPSSMLFLQWFKNIGNPLVQICIKYQTSSAGLFDLINSL